MRVFISWSGTTSLLMAEALRDWLPDVIQTCEPWISSSDIDAGARWDQILSEQLQQTQLGIICLTQENLTAPWILFEAGALSKIINKAHVCPYLLGLESTDITGPLSRFQSVKADKVGTKKLLQTINRTLDSQALTEDRFNRSFEMFWPVLESSLSRIPNITQDQSQPIRSQADMLTEVLGIVREQSSVISELHLRTNALFEYIPLIIDDRYVYKIKDSDRKPLTKELMDYRSNINKNLTE